METIERNSNSIDKLTSLVSKMNMKIDKWLHINPKFIKVDFEVKVEIGKTTINL